jgi:hypothetical protein
MNISGRKAEFDQFLEERMPVLHEFGMNLGYDPANFLQQPHLYVERLSEWLADEAIEDEDRIWILARIGYFIGEVFLSEMGGAWMVCDREDSPFYGHYVVGQFLGSEAVIVPFAAADELVNSPPPRSLAAAIGQMKSALIPETITSR